MTAETMAHDETEDATETSKPPEAPGPREQFVPTSHARLLAWVEEVAALTEPDRVHWCTGSTDEWTSLTDGLVAAGTLVKLDEDK